MTQQELDEAIEIAKRWNLDHIGKYPPQWKDCMLVGRALLDLNKEIESAPVVCGYGSHTDIWTRKGSGYLKHENDTHKARLVRIEEIK